MQSHPRNLLGFIKEESDITGSSFPNLLNNTLHEPIVLGSSEEEDDGSYVTEDGDNQTHESVSNQLVVYDPAAHGNVEIIPVPDPITFQTPIPTYPTPTPHSRVLPSVGAFTVQCASCFKWRFIPTKEKYEEIREHILEQPFFCETAREWRPKVSCDDPPDIYPDSSRLWAIDKPNIAQPPPGWQRLLRIRGEGSTKFADVYYSAPSGKRLRSMVEVRKYLLEHPEYAEQGVTLAQFSFQIPRPLQENYVRKRTPRVTAPCDGPAIARPLEPVEVNPISWAGPDETIDLQLGGPGLSITLPEAPTNDPVDRPTKRQARGATSGQMYSSNLGCDEDKDKLEGPQQFTQAKGATSGQIYGSNLGCDEDKDKLEGPQQSTQVKGATSGQMYDSNLGCDEKAKMEGPRQSTHGEYDA